MGGSTKKKKRKKYKIQKRLFWGTFFFGMLFFIGIFIYAALGFLGPMPPFEQLENPKTNLATQIISADGIVLGKFYYLSAKQFLYAFKHYANS